MPRELASSPKFLRPCDLIRRHWHEHAYATIVLAGSYEEAGECGRWQVEEGDVLLHGAFSAHLDAVRPTGARVLNLPLPPYWRRSMAARVAESDLLARLAERDWRMACEALMENLGQGRAPLADEPDLLADALLREDRCAVEQWSVAHSVSRQTSFRWFRAAYGVAPSRFRVEARAREAWRLLMDSPAPLGEVAAETGFADQAHMSRDVKALTGRSPATWRAEAATFLQD
jgi:AraC-like DNA-binding protein